MLKRMPEAFRAYPLTHAFVFHHVRMQFEDVGAMLRLPMKSQGIDNACNFATASILCNLISGVSVTLLPARSFSTAGQEGHFATYREW
jgi:hypothetical protein